MPSSQTQIFVVGDPSLLELGRERLRQLRRHRPPGLAVDEVVEKLMAEGATGVLVQLGSIVRVAGSSPTDDGWLTVVAHPLGHFATAVLRLHSGAVVTVAAPRDLLDGPRGVSVMASRAWEAELLATTALSAGADGGTAGVVEFLSAAGLPSLVVDDLDEALPLRGWSQLCAAPELVHAPAERPYRAELATSSR